MCAIADADDLDGASEAGVWNRAALLASVEEDNEFACEIIRMFLDAHIEWVAKIREAVALRDLRELAEAAHKLKGAVSIVRAASAWQAADHLESFGRKDSGDAALNDRLDDRLDEALAVLEAEIRRLQNSLTAFLQAQGAGKTQTS